MTAISESEFKTLPPEKLQKPSKILAGPTSQRLDVLGQYTTVLLHKGSSTEQEILVI